jgi:hypothetical protein
LEEELLGGGAAAEEESTIQQQPAPRPSPPLPAAYCVEVAEYQRYFGSSLKGKTIRRLPLSGCEQVKLFDPPKHQRMLLSIIPSLSFLVPPPKDNEEKDQNALML